MSGAQTSSFANVLFDPMMARRQTAADIENQYAPARNQLYLDAGTQQMARQNEVDSREHVAQVAGYILAQPQASRPTAYKAAVEWSRANGHPLPNAPAEYPGDQQMQMLQSMGIPAEQQYKIGMNRQANDAMLPPAAAPAAGGAAPAAATAPVVPAELMAHFQEASARTGIPVATLVAQAQQESSMGKSSPNIMQVLDSTARDPGFGMTGVDPAVLRDPRSNINFGADYLKARSGGGDMTDPAVRDAALKAYNGGGDPNYVANVGRYLPPGGASGGGQGVAARTPGAVDVAGPGAPSMGAPSGGAPAVPTAPGPGQYTPEQMRRLRSMQANNVPNQQLREEMDRFDTVNAHAAEQDYRRQKDALDAQHRALEEKRQADADARAAAKAKAEEAAAALPYHGNSMEPQDVNVLLTGDPSTQKYAGAYARQAAPKVNIDGSTVTPNMAAYAKPTYKGAGVDAPDYSKPVTTDPTHMSADQAKVATFASRLAAADVLIGQTSAAGLSLTQRGLAALPGGNYLASSEAQQYQQAQRDFINAVLRRESGAAIAESEFENARKQYFPQPGDGPAVIAQKAHNRATETSAFQREAGPAYVPPPAAASQAAHPPPPPGFKVIQ